MLATGLGALPVLFVRRVPERLLGVGYSIAGGMMVAVSFLDLIGPGLKKGDTPALSIGLLVGALFFWGADRFLEVRDLAFAGLSGAGARKALLILATMFVHSFPEGVAVGVGYASGETGLGWFIALAIAIHNIPEGMAISLPMSASGVGFWRCFGFSVLSSLPQPIAVIPAVLTVERSRQLLPYGLGFAAGAMVYLVLAELLPETYERTGKHGTAWGFTLGFVAMLLAQNLL
ncbi:MAG: ZIP family metal transporter [Thermoanaerobaculia bacterium]